MRAKSLKLKELLKTDPANGSLYLAENRAVLMEADALGTLRKELIDNLGVEITKGLLIRYGYRCGRADAQSLRDRCGWQSDMEWLLAGPRMHALEGVVKVENEEIRIDRPSGRFFMRGLWKNSFEAEQHLKLFGRTETPVCWSLVGYASGYASGFFGQEVFCVETECVGRGDAVCRFELQRLEEDGPEAAAYRQFFDSARFKLRYDECLHCIGNLSYQLMEMSEPRGYVESILRHSPEAIITTDADGVIRFYSRGAEALSGFAAEEMIGRHESVLYADDIGQTTGRPGSLEEKGRQHYETELLAKGGARVPVHASISCIKDRLEKVIGWLHIVRDLREAYRLTRELKERDSFLANILLDSADAIITLDADQVVTAWNKGAEQMYGYAEKEMVGRSVAILLPEDLRAAGELDQMAERLRREGILRNYQTERITKDGRRITVLLTRTAVKNERGEIVGSSVIAKDITRIKGMERQFMRAEHFAVLGELAAGLAHEIKNPLGGIKGAVEVIRDEMRNGNPHRAVLQDVLYEVDRIDKAVRDLLTYAKSKEPEFGEVDLESLLQRVVSLTQKPRKDKHITIDLSVAHAARRLWADANQLEQLFMNLVLNSIQAIEHTGRIRILVDGHTGQGVEIQVHDDGRGIPREIKDRIFQPFFTTKTEGTGLGLPICQRIVTDHNGFIDVKSTPGRGTSVRIWLPSIPYPEMESSSP